MDIAEELKRKRTEFDDRLQEIAREQVEIQAQLAVLDEARQTLSTAECSVRFVEKLGLAEDDTRVARIASRLSAVLDQVAKAGRVRDVGTIDGRRKLWQVAA